MGLHLQPLYHRVLLGTMAWARSQSWRRTTALMGALVVGTCLAMGMWPVVASHSAPSALPTSISTLQAHSPSPAQLADWIRFRTAFGLQIDETWVAIVASDPESSTGRARFGVPLMPFELQDLLSRTQARGEAVPVIASYSATTEDSYDWYIDQQRGGLIVARFTQDADTHADVLEQLLPPNTRWEAVNIDSHIVEMEALVAEVQAEREWFETVGAQLLDVFISPLDGATVELSYLSASRVMDQGIRDHFGAPAWLIVERAGGPTWVGPVGDLVVRAISSGGRSVEGLTCTLGGDAVSTNAHGECTFLRLAALSYRVQVLDGRDEPSRLVGSALVSVAPDRETQVVVPVAR